MLILEVFLGFAISKRRMKKENHEMASSLSDVIDAFMTALRLRNDGDDDGDEEFDKHCRCFVSALSDCADGRLYFMRQANATDMLFRRLNCIDEDKRIVAQLLEAVSLLTTTADGANKFAHIRYLRSVLEIIEGAWTFRDVHGNIQQKIVAVGLRVLKNITECRLGAEMVVGSNLELLSTLRLITDAMVAEINSNGAVQFSRSRFAAALSIITNLSSLSFKTALITENVPQLLTDCAYDLATPMFAVTSVGDNPDRMEALTSLLNCLLTLCNSSAGCKTITNYKVVKTVDRCMCLQQRWADLANTARRLFERLFCRDGVKTVPISGEVLESSDTVRFLFENHHRRFGKSVKPFNRVFADPIDVQFNSHNSIGVDSSSDKNFKDSTKPGKATSQLLKTVCAPPITGRILEFGEKWSGSDVDENSTLVVDAGIDQVNDLSAAFVLEHVCAALNSRRTLCIAFGLERSHEEQLVVRGGVLTPYQRDQFRLGVDCTMSKGVTPRVDPTLFSLTFVPVRRSTDDKVDDVQQQLVVVELRLRHTSELRYKLRPSGCCYILNDDDVPEIDNKLEPDHNKIIDH